YHFFGQKEFKYREKFTFMNRNPLIFADIGVDGMKTGFIKESGYGLVASAKRGDQRLILVVGGLETAKDREAEGRRMLDWGFKSFRAFPLFDHVQILSDALVSRGAKRYVPLGGH